MTDTLSHLRVETQAAQFPETEEEEDYLVGQAVWDALRAHKQAGNPIAVWEDGKVVIVQPEDIVLPEDQQQPSPKP